MKKEKITVFITTCDRYDSTFPLCFLSIVTQTRTPDRIVIVDDGKNKEFYDNNIIKKILTICKFKNVEVEYLHGQSRGQVPALRLGMSVIEDGWVFKTDDDNVMEPNVLELFEKNIQEGIGGISGVIIDKYALNRSEKDVDMSSNVDDIYSHFNVQMVGIQDNNIKDVEHLYSNYFIRRDLAEDWPEGLEPSSHREDTIFTHTIFRKGYSLIVDPKVRIYHLDDGPKTGNRKWGKEYTDKNEHLFLDKLREWNIIPDKMQVYEDDKRYYTIKNKTNFIILEK